MPNKLGGEVTHYITKLKRLHRWSLLCFSVLCIDIFNHFLGDHLTNSDKFLQWNNPEAYGEMNGIIRRKPCSSEILT